MRRENADYNYGMAQAVQILLELIPPGRLASEALLLLISAGVVRYLSPVVTSSLGDDFPYPKIAKWVRAAFGAGLSCLIALWLVSIVIRYLLFS